MFRGIHRLGGQDGQVGAVRPGLVAVHLLQREHVSVELAHGDGEPVEVDLPVDERARVQDVERGEPHPVDCSCRPASPPVGV